MIRHFFRRTLQTPRPLFRSRPVPPARIFYSNRWNSDAISQNPQPTDTQPKPEGYRKYLFYASVSGFACAVIFLAERFFMREEEVKAPEGAVPKDSPNLHYITNSSGGISRYYIVPNEEDGGLLKFEVNEHFEFAGPAETHFLDGKVCKFTIINEVRQGPAVLTFPKDNLEGIDHVEWTFVDGVQAGVKRVFYRSDNDREIIREDFESNDHQRVPGGFYVQYLSNGTQLQGILSNKGLPEGEGVLIDVDGEYFAGEWTDGVFTLT
jgi:hypothetical protein